MSKRTRDHDDHDYRAAGAAGSGHGHGCRGGGASDADWEQSGADDAPAASAQKRPPLVRESMPVTEMPYAAENLTIPPGGDSRLAEMDQQLQIAEQLADPLAHAALADGFGGGDAATDDAKNDVSLHARAQELPHTKGLPHGPDNPMLAELGTAYYRLKGQGDRQADDRSKKNVPNRYVIGRDGKDANGNPKFTWQPCCHANESGKPCTKQAGRGEGEKRNYCIKHGGGQNRTGVNWCACGKKLKERKEKKICFTCEKAKAGNAGAWFRDHL